MDNSSLSGAGSASAGLAQAHNGGPASSLSPTSPVSVRSQVFAHNGSNGGGKRKRSSVAMMGDSPESDDDDATGEHSHEKKRQPGVKRACNECRQQKVCLSQCCAPILSALSALLSCLAVDGQQWRPGHCLAFSPLPAHCLDHWLIVRRSLHNSCDVMSYKIPSRVVLGVFALSWTVRSSPTSNELANAANMQRWRRKSTSCVATSPGHARRASFPTKTSTIPHNPSFNLL